MRRRLGLFPPNMNMSPVFSTTTSHKSLIRNLAADHNNSAGTLLSSQSQSVPSSASCMDSSGTAPTLPTQDVMDDVLSQSDDGDSKNPG